MQPKGLYALVVILICIIISLCVYLFNKQDTPSIITVPSVTPSNIQQGLSTAGFTITKPEASRIVEKIHYVVENEQPIYKATVPNEKVADDTIKQVSKKDGADVVVKENKTEKEISYYGIHMEKKTGIGLYTDVNKDGSYGIHIRKERLIIQVGKKYDGGGVTGRLAYELLQF